jgi:hypothetical protein
MDKFFRPLFSNVVKIAKEMRNNEERGVAYLIHIFLFKFSICIIYF